MEDINKAIDNFLVYVNKLNDEHIESHKFEHLKEANAHITKSDPGRKFMRLVHMENGKARSVYCFVNMENGDLLKGSWKAPVKNGVRGNVFDETTYTNFDHYGPKYLR